jgi:hypothetical protein
VAHMTTASKYEKVQLVLQTLATHPSFRQTADLLLARWQHWVERFGIYDHIKKKRYIGFFTWQQDKKLIMQEDRFMDTLLALQEFTQYAKNDIANKDDIEKTLLTLADIQLAKLEIRQSKKLKKVQGLSRGNLKQDIETLREKRKKTMDMIQTVCYSKEIKETDNIPLTKAVLQYHETKFRFGRVIERSDYAVTAAKVTKIGNFSFQFINAFPTFFSALAQPFIQIGQALGIFLNSIPIIANIVSAIPILFTAAKTWFKNKSKTKKILHSIAAALAIAGIIVGAVFLGFGLLTLGGIIATGLAVVGFIALQVIPWARAMIKLSSTINDNAQVKKRIKFLSGKNHHASELTEFEKDMLLKRIEDAWLKDEFNIKAFDSKIIDDAKDLIAFGNDMISLRANVLIRKILESKSPSTLEAFLLEENKSKLKYLKDYVKELKKDEETKAVTTGNSLLAIIGAILLCIPTPPTMIIGAGLLLVSTLVGFGIKYKWGEKISNLFNRIFHRENITPSDETISHRSDYKLKKEFEKAPEETPTLKPIYLERPFEQPSTTEPQLEKQEEDTNGDREKPTLKH